jgi:uncharacterized protein YndB with AHSA1/START domain
MTTPREEGPEKRTIRLEVEVPGTPEQVWETIATGPGISAWFIPAEVDEREGGEITTHHGPGMDITGIVTAWEPPRRFAYKEGEWSPSEPSALSGATEFLVEARAGGTCVVRLVASLFGSGEGWDDQVEGIDAGWRDCLDKLRMYLTEFPGQPCATILVTGRAVGSLDDAWPALTQALGLAQTARGERAEVTAADAPALAGTVQRPDVGHLRLRTDEPAPGIAAILAWAAGDHVAIRLHAHLYGDEAAAVAARDEPGWRAWMQERFPPAWASSEIGARTA